MSQKLPLLMKFTFLINNVLIMYLSSAELVRGQCATDDKHGLDHDAKAVVDVIRVESSRLSVVEYDTFSPLKALKSAAKKWFTCILGREGP